MPTVGETTAGGAGPNSQLHAALKAGVDTLSAQGFVTFTKYIKIILPLDGYVFWVKADLLSESAMFNAGTYNAEPYNTQPVVTVPAATRNVEGSLHYRIDQQQLEDESIAINTAIFTAETEIQLFNEISPTVMFIAHLADAAGGTIKFAFTRRGGYYREADLYHYVGNAVYPALESQIIENTADLDMTSLIVSNSLPLWLAIPSFQAVWWNPGWDWPFYPSFVVPDNIAPPYASIHIEPRETQAIQAVPFLDPSSSDYQLARDLVRITIYGVRNTDARSFLVSVLEYIRNVETMGLMNMPVIHDEKRTQSELGIIAMKKTIDFEVSYTQGAVREIARQLITEAIPTLILDPFGP